MPSSWDLTRHHRFGLANAVAGRGVTVVSGSAECRDKEACKEGTNGVPPPRGARRIPCKGHKEGSGAVTIRSRTAPKKPKPATRDAPSQRHP